MHLQWWLVIRFYISFCWRKAVTHFLHRSSAAQMSCVSCTCLKTFKSHGLLTNLINEWERRRRRKRWKAATFISAVLARRPSGCVLAMQVDGCLGEFTDSAQFPVLQGLCMFRLEQWGRWFSIPLKGFGMLFQSRYKCYAVICTPDHIWKCLKWSDNNVFPERPRSHLYLALYTYDWCECHAITVNSAHTITSSQMFEVRYLTTSWLKPCFTVLQLSFPVPWNHQYKVGLI